jgi:hypothetical protein
MAKRYAQMLPIVAALKPTTIVEVGVHKGLRGSALSLEALKHSGHVRYIGYDVFDTMSEKFQREALNGKRTQSEAQARRSFDPIAKQYAGFSYQFHVGDTRNTLHKSYVVADFAFIDGDHRVEAIREDWLALSGSSCIVFDDYYKPGPSGALPDLSKYGANKVIEELIAEGRQVEILPAGDLCTHGGIAHLAVVRQ